MISAIKKIIAAGAQNNAPKITAKNMASQSPVDPSLLEWAEYWYPISWKGLLVAGVLAAVSACATVGFFVLQWRTTTIRERQGDWRTASLENDAAQARLEQKRLEKVISETDARAEEAHARAVEAKLALEKFKAPRMLSPEQQERVVKAIKPFAGQEYALSVASGAEAEGFLCLLASVLEKAGWVRLPPFGNITVDTPCGTVGVSSASGIHIRLPFNPSPELLPKAVALHDSLTAEGIATDGGQDPKNIPKDKTNAFFIMVGSKPQ